MLVETALGRLRARATDIPVGEHCVLAIRPENLSLDGAADNTIDGRVRLSAYLGNILRYDVETAAGLVLTVDVRDPWHHDVLPPGRPVRVAFPSSVALMLRDE
jgi:ABC-type Fe3+/spermidine/putrescine transport system ATPase subunit